MINFLKKLLGIHGCEWQYYRSDGTPCGPNTHYDPTYWYAQIRQCKTCEKVQHCIKATCGQGDCHNAWWEDEESVMKKFETGEYYGDNRTLAQVLKEREGQP